MNNSGRLTQGQKLVSNCLEDLHAESIDEIANQSKLQIQRPWRQLIKLLTR